jgi:hypothetical protein
MRTRVTDKAWFGPKRYLGWGWRITSWEGGLVTAVFGLLVLVSVLVWGRACVVPVLVLLGLYLTAVVLTGDPPGSSRSDSD